MAVLVQILVLCVAFVAADKQRVLSHEERRTAAALGVASIDYYAPEAMPSPAHRSPRRWPYRYHHLYPYSYINHWYADAPRPYVDPRPVQRPDESQDDVEVEKEVQEPKRPVTIGKSRDPAADFAKSLDGRPANERPQDEPAVEKFREPEFEEKDSNISKDPGYVLYPVGTATPAGSNQPSVAPMSTNVNTQPITNSGIGTPVVAQPNPGQVQYVYPQNYQPNVVPVSNPAPQYTLVSIPNNAYNQQPNNNIYYVANQAGGYQVANPTPAYILNNQPAQLVPINTNQPQYVILNNPGNVASQSYVALNQPSNGIPSGSQYVTLQPNNGPYFIAVKDENKL